MPCHRIVAILAFVSAAAVPACRQQAPTVGNAKPQPSSPPDPLISGQRLSAWIASLEDRDPEVQLKALHAINKLKQVLPETINGAALPLRQRATDAEVAHQPLNVMAQRPITSPVVLAVQHDLFSLFQETDSRYVEPILTMLANGGNDESYDAMTLLEHYPDQADRITDAALALAMQPH